MSEPSPLSPEARRKAGEPDALDHSGGRRFGPVEIGEDTMEVLRRVGVGVYSDGFVYAGNFAYLALLAIFAFFIVAAAMAGLFGRTEDGFSLIQAFLQTVPPSVAETLKGPVESAMTARSGPVLWLSAAVGLWTTGSLIETLRDILHRAYGVTQQRPFWEYRLSSIIIIVSAVMLAMLAFSMQVLFVAVEQFVAQFLPWAGDVASILSLSRIVPFLVLFAALYLIYRTLSPRRYRGRKYPKWPGAVFTSAWWLGCTTLLPVFLRNMADYDLTYGSLAGAMIALIFFFLIGLGVVTGAELNAALAIDGRSGIKRRLTRWNDKEAD